MDDLSMTKAPFAFQRPADCVSPDALFRYRRNYCTQEEAELVRAHLTACSDCQADLDSVECFESDMLIHHRNCIELDNFRPNSTHASVCRQLTDARLAKIVAERRSETLEQTHMCNCPYCLERLLLAGASGQQHSRPRLAGALLRNVVRKHLELAAERVMAAVPWEVTTRGRQLVVKLRAWVSEQGATLVTGLEQLLSTPQLQYETLGSETTALEQSWNIPVEDLGIEVQIAVQPSRQDKRWGIRLEFIGTLPVEEVRLTFSHSEQGTVFAGTWSQFAGEDYSFDEGLWTLDIELGATTLTIPLELASEEQMD